MSDSFLRALITDLAGAPSLVAGPGSASDIDLIEAFAEFRLPPHYRAFLEVLGAAVVGPYSVYGVGASEAMSQDEASVILVTQRYRSDRWPTTQKSLVLSSDHAGNPITLDAQGVVYRYDHDTGVTEVMARDFGQLIEKLLALSQGEANRPRSAGT